VSQFYTVPFALLHCVSAYPADPADCNLRAIATLSEDFNCPAGWSDHTTGIEVAIAAAALGAAVIEKHFTLDKNAPGPDHKASMEPDELAALVVGVRKVEAALGDGTKAPTAAEAEIASVARKSLVAATDLKQGEKLEMGMVAAKRPGTGLSPTRLGELLGKRLVRDVLKGEQLSLDMFGA
jgi:N,N'-diacetyllegionaminate synthase